MRLRDSVRCPECSRELPSHAPNCRRHPGHVLTERVQPIDGFDYVLGNPPRNKALRKTFTCGNCYSEMALQWQRDIPSEVQVHCLGCTAPAVSMHDLLEFGEAAKKERDNP